MALIKCPKCGKEMSDRAASCPQCGMTMEEIKAAMHETTLNDARETSQIPLSQLTTAKKRVDIYIDGELFYTTDLDGFIKHINF
ncbi:MAG: zinc ribbon domain-containing protein [Bacteroidales bacterium]|nr:zinc ribbon domain-containing protein [Bacteroidales bacterium]